MVACLATVVKGAEKTVEDHEATAVVTFEMLMMEVVEMAAALDRQPAAEFDPFEAGMCRRGIEDRELYLEQGV